MIVQEKSKPDIEKSGSEPEKKDSAQGPVKAGEVKDGTANEKSGL